MRNQKGCAGEFPGLFDGIQGLDAEGAIENMGGSAELYKKMMMQVIRLLPANIKYMDEYCADGTLGDFAIKAHGVKGALYQSGNLKLARAAELLEREAKAGNLTYCQRHYEAFRGDLLCFFEQIRLVLDNGEETKCGETADIKDYADALNEIKAALEEFDSIFAAEIILPLTKMRFGGAADILIAEAAEAVESFRPQKALECIMKIIEANS